MKLIYTLICISLVLFALSLTQPVFICYGASYLGYEVLMIGWLGIPLLEPRWIANLFYFYIIFKVTFSDNKQPQFSAIVLIITAFTTLTIPAGGCPITGGVDMSRGLRLGGYLWVASLLLLAFSTFTNKHKVNET